MGRTSAISNSARERKFAGIGKGGECRRTGDAQTLKFTSKDHLVFFSLTQIRGMQALEENCIRSSLVTPPLPPSQLWKVFALEPVNA